MCRRTTSRGDSRYFVLGRGDPVSTDSDEQTVTIRFQYRQITEDEADDYVEAYNEATGDDRSSFAHMTPAMRCDALSKDASQATSKTQEPNASSPQRKTTTPPLRY